MARALLDDLSLLTLLLAALVHDMGHDGFTNAFHKAPAAPVASLPSPLRPPFE